MNLPTCPSCGQSVLDDDAQDCPFCGSSMKAGSGKSKQAAPAAPSRPAAEKSPAGSSSAKKSAEGTDDPFAVSSGVSEKAIPARAKPSQTHRFKVTCPMCDTVGYLPASAAGQEVRCANAKCLVPVFTAPEIKKKKKAPAPAPPPPKVSASRIIWVAVAIVVLIGAGGAIWQLFLRRPDFTAPPVAYTPPSQTDPTETDPGDGQPVAEPVDEPAETATSLADLQEEILPKMAELSQVSENNRSKPFCYRLTAEAYAMAGRTAEAQSQIEKLQQAGAGIPYYQVTPLVQIARSELAANNPEAAGRTLEAALQAAEQLPPVGRYRLDAVTALAAALVVADQTQRAADFLAPIEEDGSLSQLSALVQTAQARGTFNIDEALSHEFWDRWEAPQWTAVALVLAADGHWEQAMQWCRSHPQPGKRIGSLVVWAEEYVTHAMAAEGTDWQSLVETAAADLTPGQKARLYARIAARQASAGDREGAAASLQTATEALDSVEVPTPITLTDMKDVYHRELPDPTDMRIAAKAAMEVAYAQSLLEQSEQAWNSVALALEFTRGFAPSPASTQERIDQLNRLGTSAASSQLKSALELDGNDQAFRALQTYRSQCIRLNKAAEDRFRFQVSLLEDACDWQIRDQLWKEIESRSQEGDPSRREPYLESRLPWLLLTASRAKGDEGAAEQIEKAMTNLRQRPDPQLELIAETTALVEDGSMLKAARAIDRSRLDKGWRAQLYLQLVGRLAGRGDIEPAYELSRRAVDATWGEEAMEMVSARAVLAGRAGEIWQTIEQRQLNPTDKIALCRGLVAGIAATDENLP